MSKDPLTTIVDKEKELADHLEQTISDEQEKTAEFKREQEQKLSGLTDELQGEISKINDQADKDTKGRVAIIEQEQKSALADLDNIDQGVVKKLSQTIVNKVIKSVE